MLLRRTCNHLFRFKNCSLSSISISIRNLTQTEAAVALRPFYFAVHPDRYAKDPEVQNQNEKSLQIFNGYLNELFTESNANVKPVVIVFSILQKESGAYEKVSLSLVGTDPHIIVRNALERCKLSTESLPTTKKPSSQFDTNSQYDWSNFYGSPPNFYEYEDGFGPSTSFSSEFDFGNFKYFFMDDDDISRRPRKKKQSQSRSSDLAEHLSRLRDISLKKTEAHQRTTDLLEDEIDYLKRKTGVSMIIWEIDWDIKYMQRAIIVVKQMLSAVPKDYRETIVFSLNKQKLIFGRGTYITVDGSIQFGADDVPEKWMTLCLNAYERRFKIKELNDITHRVQTMLGNATLIIDPHKNLYKVIRELNFLYNKLGYKAKKDGHFRSLGSNTLIEVVSPYGELAIGKDGVLQIPSNANFTEVKSFLYDFGHLSKKLHSTVQQEFDKIDRLKRDCINKLNLKTLTSDSGLDLELVQKTIEKLISNIKIKPIVSGLSLHISNNNSVYCRTNGSINIPLEPF